MQLEMLLVVVFSSIHLVYAITKDDVKVTFERVEILFPDPNVYRGNFTNRKYNRTTLVMDSYYDQLVWLKRGESSVKVSAYQFLSNTYRLSSIQFEIDYCTTLISGDFGQQTYHNNSNYPQKCPIPPGKYYVKDAVIPTSVYAFKADIPPNFLGRWQLSLDNLLHKKSYYVYNVFFNIQKKPKWSKKNKLKHK